MKSAKFILVRLFWIMIAAIVDKTVFTADLIRKYYIQKNFDCQARKWNTEKRWNLRNYRKKSVFLPVKAYIYIRAYKIIIVTEMKIRRQNGGKTRNHVYQNERKSAEKREIMRIKTKEDSAIKRRKMREIMRIGEWPRSRIRRGGLGYQILQ